MVFLLGLGASETKYKPFRKRMSVSYSILGPLDFNPIGFLSQMFWAIIFLVQIPEVGMPL